MDLLVPGVLWSTVQVWHSHCFPKLLAAIITYRRNANVEPTNGSPLWRIREEELMRLRLFLSVCKQWQSLGERLWWCCPHFHTHAHVSASNFLKTSSSPSYYTTREWLFFSVIGVLSGVIKNIFPWKKNHTTMWMLLKYELWFRESCVDLGLTMATDGMQCLRSLERWSPQRLSDNPVLSYKSSRLRDLTGQAPLLATAITLTFASACIH